MRKSILLLALLLPLGVLAQQQEKKVFNQAYNMGEYAPMSVSYYGNFATHPGIKLGMDWNLLMVEKTKEKRKKIKTIRKLLLVTPSIAFYHHKASHQGLILATDLAWRRYGKKLLYKEVSLGMGYFRRFNAGETWEVVGDGVVTNIGNTSRGYFSPSLSFGIGKRFMLQEQTPAAIFSRLNINGLVNYNASTIAELSLELGVRMTLSKGIKRGEVKTITK